jgi:hypothetical protein
MSARFDVSSGIDEGVQPVNPDRAAHEETACDANLWAGVVRDEILNFSDRDQLIKFDKKNDGQLTLKEIRAFTKDYEKSALKDKEGLSWSFDNLLDRNGDGRLSRDEQKLTQDYLLKDTPLGAIDFSKAKADKDGNVSLDDFLKAAGSRSTWRNAKEIATRYADDIMKRFDTNGDNVLDFALEAKPGPPEAPPPNPAQFARDSQRGTAPPPRTAG